MTSRSWDRGRNCMRTVPARRIETVDGPRFVTTAFDLLLAQYGVARDLGEGPSGDWPSSYEDARHPFTPSWQEQFTGVSAKDVIRFAREWGRTAETTKGRCMVIIGAGVNHWYHNNLIYRACITALMVTGCIGRNGGGWNHYVGQEKLVPTASWAPIAFASGLGRATPSPERPVIPLHALRSVALRPSVP